MEGNTTKKYLHIAGCTFGVIAASIIFFFVIYKLDDIGRMLSGVVTTMMPFIIGAILAYIICPLCNIIENWMAKPLKKIVNEERAKKVSSAVGIFAGIIIALVAVYMILMILIPQLIDSIVRIVQLLPGGADNITAWLNDKLSSNEQLLKYSQQIFDKAYTALADWLDHSLLDTVNKFAAGISTGVVSMLSILMNVFVGVIVAIYLLFSRKRLARQGNLIIYSIFKKKNADFIVDEIKYIDKVFSGFINGKILDAVVIALICYLGMMVFKLFNPGDETMSEVLVAVIVGIFNVIPFFGWYIGWGLSAVLILIVNPAQCIYFVIFDFILQQLDGNVIGPKIIGNTTGISSLWVLFSILLFGDIWGFAGMLIGVPVFAVIYHGIKRAVYIKLKKNELDNMIDEYEAEFPNKSDEEGVEEAAWLGRILNPKSSKVVKVAEVSEGVDVVEDIAVTDDGE